MKKSISCHNIKDLSNICIIPLTTFAYTAALFRPINNIGVIYSFIILAVLIICAIQIGRLKCLKKINHHFTNSIRIILPFGIYTYIASFSQLKAYILATSIISAVLTFLIAFVCVVGINDKALYTIDLISFCIKEVLLIMALTAVFSAIIMLYMCFHGFEYNNTLNVDLSSTNNYNAYTDSSKVKASVLSFRTDKWKALNTEERLQASKDIADMESISLGLAYRINVVIGENKNIADSSYNDRSCVIIISPDIINSDEPLEVLDAVCHEVRHSWQHRVADLYQTGKIQSGSLYNKAEKFDYEFHHYINSTVDFEKYYDQTVEKDAREYAKNRVNDYYMPYMYASDKTKEIRYEAYYEAG